jgi:hypothetical protein
MFIADGDYCELGAYEPFNGNNNCLSWADEPGYSIGKDCGDNFLTN